MILEFIAAVQFLTVLRFRKGKDNITAGSIIYFPLVGAFLGTILIICNALLTGFLPGSSVSLLLVTALIILTGALHLDGLADTCDALFSGKESREKLSIMRDPRKGTFGILGLLAVILFKINLLYLIPAGLKNAGIFLMLVFSRYSMNIGINFFGYARGEGKADIFFKDKNLKDFLSATLLAVILASLTLWWLSFPILVFITGFTFAVNKIIRRSLGGLTGDTLGALCELNEIVVLLSIIIISKLNI